MVDSKPSNKELYLQWLSTELSGTTFNECCLAYDEIEKYCYERKKITQKLLEIEDINIISIVKDVVEKDRVFRFYHRDNKDILMKAINLFYKYIKSKNEISNKTIMNESNDIVFEYMKKINHSQTLSEIVKESGINDEKKALESLKNHPSIVLLNEKIQEYIYAPSFPIKNEELKEIQDFLESELKEREFIIDLELRDYIDENMENFSEVILSSTRYGWRNCVAYLLREKFSFNNAIISRKGISISSLDCYSKLCSSKSITTISELKKLSSLLKLPIPFGQVLSECVRIDEQTFVRKDKIAFDISAIDTFLNAKIKDEYLPLLDFEGYDEMPEISYEWNGYVLESYLQQYSKEFKLVNLNFSVNEPLGAIVKRDSGIVTYKDLIYHVLKDNKQKWSDSISALKYLVEKKYQMVASCEYIDEVLKNINEEIEKNSIDFPNNEILVELDKLLKYPNYNPVRYEYFGEVYPSDNSWKKLYISFVKVLMDDYGIIIEKLVDKRIVNELGYGGLSYSNKKDKFIDPIELPNGIYIENATRSKKIDISKTKESLIEPIMLKEGLYLELDLNLCDIFKRISAFLEICKIDEENLKIYCIKNEYAISDDFTENLKKINENHVESSNYKVIDMVTLDKFINYDIIDFKYFDRQTIEVNSWKDLYIHLVKNLTEDYKEIIDKIINRKIVGVNDDEDECLYSMQKEKLRVPMKLPNGMYLEVKIRPLKSDLTDEKNKQFLNEPVEIASDIYLESEYTPKEILRRIKSLLGICMVPKGKVFITISSDNLYLQPEEGKKAQEEIKINDTKGNMVEYENVKDNFHVWLQKEKGLTIETCQNYTKYGIDIINTFIKFNLSDAKNLYLCSYEDGVKIKNKLLNDYSFIKKNEEQHYTLEAALSCFVDFLRANSDSEINEQVELESEHELEGKFELENRQELENTPKKNVENDCDNIIKRNRNKFYMWLSRVQKLSEGTRDAYARRGINEIDNFCVREKIYNKSLCMYTKLSQVNELKKTLMGNEDFVRINNIKYNFWMTVLNNYIKCIKNGFFEENSEEFEKETDEFSQKVVVYKQYIEKKFYTWLNKIEGLSTAVCNNYTKKGISEIDEFAKKYEMYDGSLYNYSDCNQIVKIIHRCSKHIEFKRLNFINYNRPNQVLKKYYKFLKYNNSETKTKEKNKETAVSGKVELPVVIEKIKKYKKVFEEGFKRQYRYGSQIDRNRFKKVWKSTYGEELAVENEVLEEYIGKFTIKLEKNRVSLAVLPDTLLVDEEKEALINQISGIFSSGKEVIFYKALYEENLSDLCKTNITNSDLLKEYLKYSLEGKYYFYDTYFSINKNPYIDTGDEIKQYLLNCNGPVPTDKIYEDLYTIPIKVIKETLKSQNGFFTNNQKERFHADIVKIDKNILQDIENILKKEIDCYKFVTKNYLLKIIKTKYTDLLETYSQIKEVRIVDVILYKLNNVFYIDKNVISDINDKIRENQVYINYLKRHSSVTLTELNTLADELGSNSATLKRTVYDLALRIDKDKFIYHENLNLDSNIDILLDEVLDKYCFDEYIPIQKIKSFTSFPNVGFSWNIFLLESLVSKYSKKFKLIHTGFNENICTGAIVKVQSKIKSMQDLIVDIVVKNNIDLNENVILDYLVELGILGRRSYADINFVISQAREKLNKEGKL